MKMIFKNLLNWLFSRKKIKKYSRTVFVQSMLDVPKKTGETIYVIEKEGSKKWVIFSCPCSKKNRVEVNLMKTRKPYWELSILNKKISLSPSVIVTGECNCHFWLKNNKIFIC